MKRRSFLTTMFAAGGAAFVPSYVWSMSQEVPYKGPPFDFTKKGVYIHINDRLVAYSKLFIFEIHRAVNHDPNSKDTAIISWDVEITNIKHFDDDFKDAAAYFHAAQRELDILIHSHDGHKYTGKAYVSSYIIQSHVHDYTYDLFLEGNGPLITLAP